ncbi:MAG: alkaline phosphatase family protein [Varibaculum sp.]|nr:alkaline phosphatase family protein [Varibaculum sp.]
MQITEIANEIHAACNGSQSIFGSPKQLILILADGLGLHNLRAHPGHARYLNSLTGVAARTCVPATTAAALTALLTGAEPGESRMLGYQVRSPINRQPLDLIQFRGDPAIDPSRWSRVSNIFQKWGGEFDMAAIGPAKFSGSGMSQVTLSGAAYTGTNRIEESLAAALTQLKAGRRFIYLYHGDLDHIGHHYGWGSQRWLEALEDFDSVLHRFASQLPAGAAVWLTADHGMVDTDIAHHLRLDTSPFASSIEMVTGEPRAGQIHLNATVDEQHFAENLQDWLGERALVVRREQLGDYYGAIPEEELTGQLTVFMRDNWVLLDSRWHKPQAMELIGVHGSLTDMEMDIPLLELT